MFLARAGSSTPYCVFKEDEEFDYSPCVGYPGCDGHWRHERMPSFGLPVYVLENQERCKANNALCNPRDSFEIVASVYEETCLQFGPTD